MKKIQKEVTQELLHHLFSYNKDTGIFTRRTETTRSYTKIGEEVGAVSSSGYIIIIIGPRPYPAHRLAWLYVYGEWPSGNIDHIDTVRTNNRINNLRDVSQAINTQNIRKPQKNNKTGFLGVSKEGRTGNYRATIYFNGKRTSLGTFKNPEEAHQVYLDAKRKYHSGCTL